MILSDDILAVRWKDRFDPDYDALPIGGYRDLQMLGLVEMDGRYHYVEVQINIKTMLQIKSGGRGTGGHRAFSTARALDCTSPRQLRFKGMPSEGVWSTCSAGLLLEVTLDGFDLDDRLRKGFIAAIDSEKCRLRKVSLVKCGLVGVDGGKFIAGPPLVLCRALAEYGWQLN